jgi:metallo-beta-lactamase class B
MTYEEVKQKYQQHHLAFYRDPGDFACEPFRIFGPLYYVGDKRVCEHLIDTGDGLVLIDSGYPHTIHLLVDSVWRLGFDPKDIRYIIHTHGHYDHYGASNEFKRLYGCQLVISRTDAELIRDNPSAASGSWSSIVTPLAYIPPAFDHLLEDGEDFVCGNLSIHCVEVPGHTPGAMAFFFDLAENGRTLRAGLFGGAGLGSVRKCVLEHRHQPLSLQQDMLDSLEKVRGEKVDIHLGNHPDNNDTFGRRARQLAGDPDAWIDPAAWDRFLDAARAKFEKMFAEEAAEAI